MIFFLDSKFNILLLGFLLLAQSAVQRGRTFPPPPTSSLIFLPLPSQPLPSPLFSLLLVFVFCLFAYFWHTLWMPLLRNHSNYSQFFECTADLLCAALLSIFGSIPVSPTAFHWPYQLQHQLQFLESTHSAFLAAAVIRLVCSCFLALWFFAFIFPVLFGFCCFFPVICSLFYIFCCFVACNKALFSC